MRGWHRLPRDAVHCPVLEVPKAGRGPGQPELVLDVGAGSSACGGAGTW